MHLTTRHARWARWCIARNPMYLLSAGCMAAGARMYLVDPSNRAGEIGLILLTFGVLQAYELAVTSVLLFLHARRRSPEDRPSLLLVATLFWTGPLAATAEMVALNPRKGALVVAGACLLALSELRVVRRALGLQLSIGGRLAAGACIVLLGVLPLLLKLPRPGSGVGELYMYLGWWLLGGVVLLSLRTARFHARESRRSQSLGPTARDLHLEVALLILVLGATCAHLVAMNYAFLTHARLFYASPLLVALAVVGLDYLALAAKSNRWLVSACAGLPAVAIALTFQTFDEQVPTACLPGILRDPRSAVLAISIAAWWFGAWRHASPVMLHAGNASLGLALLWVINGQTTAVPVGMPSREVIIVLAYVITGYLAACALLRWSRTEAFACLWTHQVAVTAWQWERSDAGLMIILLVAGWQWLLWHRLAARRPDLAAACLPVLLLVATTWAYELHDSLFWAARGHALAMVAVLAVIGFVGSQRRYALIAALVAAGDVVFCACRWAATGAKPTANVMVLVGFALLAAGATVSWYKSALLDLTRGAVPPEPGEASGSSQELVQ